MKINEVFNSQGQPDLPIVKPYIIAEAGVNHEGSMAIAERLIIEAAQGGADAIKFQSYKAETLASKDSPAYWDTTKETTTSQFDLFKKHDSFWKKEFDKLKSICDREDIEFLSTPFDIESATFLNELMDVYKISSSDITNKPFIQFICQFDKPIILSTGASYLQEVRTAEQWISENGNPLALLHCVLNYPTLDPNAQLGSILGLKKHFPQHIIGYSDHTLPNDLIILQNATLLGARIIEKHFTHDKTLPGNDHYHAMDKEDLKRFKDDLSSLFETLGNYEVSTTASQEPARRNARRSLVTNRFVAKGKRIEASDLTWKRPAHGISPAQIDEIIGLVSKIDIEADTVLQMDMFAPLTK